MVDSGRGAGIRFHGSYTRPAIDIMSRCGAWVASDFSYQVMAHARQSPTRHSNCGLWGEVAKGGAGASGVAARSARADDAFPASIALTGTLSEHGFATVATVRPTTNPPWAPADAGAVTLELLDGGGLVLHREPVPVVRRGGHGHAEHADAAWSARVPYHPDAETLVVRGPHGAVLAERPLELDGASPR